MLVQTSNINMIPAPTKGHQTITPNHLLPAPIIEVAIPDTEGVILTKPQIADSLDLVLLLITMDPRTGAEGATSAVFSGHRPGLVAVVDATVRALTTKAHRLLPRDRHLRVVRSRPADPIMAIIPGPPIGTTQEKTAEVAYRRTMTMHQPCHLRPASRMLQLLRIRVESSVLPSKPKRHQLLPRSPCPILHNGCRFVSHRLVRLQLNHQLLATA